MKLILVLITLASLSVNAETYVCDVIETNQTITFGLVESLPTQPDWDSTGRFKLSLQTTELPFPDYVEEGIANEADVWFTYDSLNSDISFGMYLDDNDPVKFKFKGIQLSFNNCRWYEFNQ